MNDVARTDGRVVVDDDVREQTCLRPDLHLGPDDAVRADLGAGIDLGALVNDRSRMNRHRTLTPWDRPRAPQDALRSAAGGGTCQAASLATPPTAATSGAG